MKDHFARILIIAMIVLLMVATAYADSKYFRNPEDDTIYLTPIPWETIEANQPNFPIEDKYDAVIQAQRQLVSSRLRSE